MPRPLRREFTFAKKRNGESEREFIFQVRQTKYYSELINTAEGYQNRQTPI